MQGDYEQDDSRSDAEGDEAFASLLQAHDRGPS